ncbi:MAG: pyrroline-5-carboxylate reductase [Deltaproteobacteria bacterium]|nr:pyrroline-5-carboxylate reductase [Deltaproteobacteria bacterium]
MDKKIAVVGCGNMGGAIAKGLVQSRYSSAESIVCCDSDQSKLEILQRQLSVRSVRQISALSDECEIVIVAVKPQIVRAVIEQLSVNYKKGKEVLIISVAAGVKLATIRSFAQDAPNFRYVRVMPNIACVYASGITALYSEDLNSLLIAESILITVGSTVRMEQESDLDIATALSASGPGFMFALIEAFAQGGVQLGLSATLSLELTAKMVYGAAQMLIQSGEQPSILRDRVATPGGTTVAGLQVIEQAGVREALINALEAATKRAREISQS